MINNNQYVTLSRRFNVAFRETDKELLTQALKPLKPLKPLNLSNPLNPFSTRSQPPNPLLYLSTLIAGNKE